MWHNSQRVIYYNEKDQVRLVGTIIEVLYTIGGERYDLAIEWDSIGGTYTYSDSDNVIQYLSPYKDMPEKNPNRAFKREKESRR